MRIYVIAALLILSGLSLDAAKKDPVYREARRNGALTKIVLHVADDDGTPVVDASVRVFLGMNFRPKGRWIGGATDTNGMFVVEGKTCGDEIEVCVAKAGYYDTKAKYCYAEMGAEHEVKNGRWQPYGEEQKILLRQIKNPVPLISEYTMEYKYTEKIGQWIGYDIEKNDFVAPSGTGPTSDFEVFLDWDGRLYPDCKRIGLRLRFNEPYSGYYEVPAISESELTVPYVANPEMTFVQSAAFYDEFNGKRLRNTFDRSKCWVVRSRCKVDAYGRLLAANYSVVRFVGISGSRSGKAGFCFFAAFNPKANDTNIEDVKVAKRSSGFVRPREPPSKR